MSIVQPYGSIRFYDSVNKIQNKDCFTQFPTLWNGRNYLMDFQFFRESTGEAITTFKLMNSDNTLNTDLISFVANLEIESKTGEFGNFEAIIYKQPGLFSIFDIGYYYLHIGDTNIDVYSSYFKII